MWPDPSQWYPMKGKEATYTDLGIWKIPFKSKKKHVFLL